MILNIKKQVDINQCKYVCIKLVRACWENWQYALTMQVPFGDPHCSNDSRRSPYLLWRKSNVKESLQSSDHLFSIFLLYNMIFIKSIRLDFSVLNFLCVLSDLLLTKTPILPNYQVPNGFFCAKINFIIQELKFCKIAHLFCER